MRWNSQIGLSRSVRRRRQHVEFGCQSEVCEERLLLSATAISTTGAIMASGHSAPASGPTKIVRDPSSGGPNGTTYLANDASTPPNWAQQQNATAVPPLDANVISTTPALNETELPLSGAFNLGPGTSLNGPAVGGSGFGNPTSGNFAFDGQSLTPSQANFSTSPLAFGSLTSGSATLSGNQGVNGPNSLNGLGQILPLPDLDLAFMQTLDITSPTGW
jgi:hypothetical protein